MTRAAMDRALDLVSRGTNTSAYEEWRRPTDEARELCYLSLSREKPTLPPYNQVRAGFASTGGEFLERRATGVFRYHEAPPNKGCPTRVQVIVDMRLNFESLITATQSSDQTTYGHFGYHTDDILYPGPGEADLSDDDDTEYVTVHPTVFRSLADRIDHACSFPNEDGNTASPYQALALAQRIWADISAAMTEKSGSKPCTPTHAFRLLEKRRGDDMFKLPDDRKASGKAPSMTARGSASSRGGAPAGRGRRDTRSPSRSRSRSRPRAGAAARGRSPGRGGRSADRDGSRGTRGRSSRRDDDDDDSSPSRSSDEEDRAPRKRSPTPKPKPSGGGGGGSSSRRSDTPGSRGNPEKSDESALWTSNGWCFSHMRHLLHHRNACKSAKADCKYHHPPKSEVKDRYSDEGIRLPK